MSSDEANLPPALPSLDLSKPGSSRRTMRIAALALLLLIVLAAAAFLFGRIYFGRVMRANLPQLDGTQVAYGLSAPVTVQRDAHGVPFIHAQSMDDLVFAQGYITAVPEPSTYALMGLGLLFVLMLSRRRRVASGGCFAAVFG